MAAKRLDQYRGRLTASQIAAGMNAANANAKRLADVAVTLLEGGNHPLAASIAVLSIEEAGKVPILRYLSVARTDDEVSQCWRDYRSHTKKNVMWLFPQLVEEGARRLDEFRSLFDEDAEHPFLLDQLKQLGFYTDCLGDAHWSVPDEVIDLDLANSLVRTAVLLGKSKKVTEAEVDLWVKHLGPAWKGPMERMEHALVEWDKEMQEMGLAESSGTSFEEFILHGVGADQARTNLAAGPPSSSNRDDEREPPGKYDR